MMKVTAIGLRNFRKFIEPVSITGLGSGINIIAGDNEDGKSTILLAIKAALYTKHSTSSTQAFQPYNSSALPEVRLDFEIGERAFRLRKSFGRKGTAELRTPDGIFQGSEAEEQLQALLNLGGDKNKESSVWNVLWVDQGTAVLNTDVGDVGRRTISGALESELGKIVSGDDGHKVLKRVSDLYLQWYTKKSGQHAASSEYKKTEQQLQEVSEEFERLSADHDAYQSTLKDSEQIRAALKTHEQQGSIAKAQQRLAAAKKVFEGVKEKTHKFEKLSAEEKAAVADYKNVSQQWETRRVLTKDIADLESSIVACNKDKEDLQSDLDKAAQYLCKCHEAEADAEAANERAKTQLESAEAQVEHAALSAEQAELTAKIKQVEEAKGNAEISRKQADAIKCDRAALDKLRVLEREALQSKTQLEAVATKVQFQLLAGKKIQRDGSKFDPTGDLLLTDQAIFELEDWGKVIITPGGEDLASIRKRAADMATAMNNALRSLQVESIGAAEEQEREKVRLTKDASDYLKSVQSLAPTGLSVINERLNVVAAKLKDIAERSGGAQLISLPEAEELRKQARLDQQASAKALTDTMLAAQSANAQLEKLNERAKGLFANEQTLKSKLDKLNEKIKVDRDAEADLSLEQRMTESRVAKDKLTSQCELLSNELKESNAADCEREIKAADEALNLVQAEIQQLAQKQSELTGSLQAFGKGGIREEFQKITQKKEQLEMQAARMLKKARAIKLLYETLVSAEQSSKANLFEPLMRQLEPCVSTVFDDGAIAFDGDGFKIKGLRRSNLEEGYDSLSLGTREQLSVLTRVAFAYVLAQSSCPAILILDDALVYSDERRIAKMQEVLQQAAKSFQILILTCRSRDWENVQGDRFDLDKCVGVEFSANAFSSQETTVVKGGSSAAGLPAN